MRLLAIDPGKTTGIVALDDRSGAMRPSLFDATPFGRFPRTLHEYLTGFVDGVDHIVLEGWESHGRSLNINVRWALEAIGMVRAAAHLHDTPLFEAYSSQWKPQYQRGWELMKVPTEVKARKAERGLAHHIYHDLKDWPDDLAAIKEPDKGHVINALALGLWAIPQLEQQAKLEALGY